MSDETVIYVTEELDTVLSELIETVIIEVAEQGPPGPTGGAALGPIYDIISGDTLIIDATAGGVITVSETNSKHSSFAVTNAPAATTIRFTPSAESPNFFTVANASGYDITIAFTTGEGAINQNFVDSANQSNITLVRGVFFANQRFATTSTAENGNLTHALTSNGGYLVLNNAKTYADGKVENNLTVSTTVAPSKSAVNTALDLKIDTSTRGQSSGVATLDAYGQIPIGQIPPAAIERLVVVADQTARYALTTTTVQLGDTVKQTDTGQMYFVSDDANLSNSAGYTVYSAGTSSACSGLSATATALATPRTIDGISFDGTANITVIAPATHVATSKATPVDADELPLVDSAASNVLKKLTWANLKAAIATYYNDLTATMTGKTITALILSAGGTGAGTAPIKFTSGSLRSTLVGGEQDYDGKVFYQSPTSGNRGVTPAIIFQALSADYTLGTGTADQKVFNGSSNGAVTLESDTTYSFEMLVRYTGDTTSSNKSIGLVIAGGASMTMSYEMFGAGVIADTNVGSLVQRHGTSAGTVILLATNTAAGGVMTMRGIIRVTTGGTITPSFKQSVNFNPVVKKDSYIMLTPIGSASAVSSGNWS